MNLDEAIKHAKEVATSQCSECADEHKQLAEWLEELKRYKDKTPITIKWLYNKFEYDQEIDKWVYRQKDYHYYITLESNGTDYIVDIKTNGYEYKACNVIVSTIGQLYSLFTICNLQEAAKKVFKESFDDMTMQDIFDKAVLLAKESKEKAIKFFNKYAEWILKAASDVSTIEEAKHRAKHNLGYIAGRYSKEIVDLIYSTYECEHPYLGKHPYDLTPSQIMQMYPYKDTQPAKDERF